MRKAPFRTAILLAGLLFSALTPISASGAAIPNPLHPHVALSPNKTSSYLSWVAPTGIALGNTAMAAVQVKVLNGNWLTKIQVPWWQSLVNISSWSRDGVLARIIYIDKKVSSLPSDEVDLSVSRQLLENFRYSQENHLKMELDANRLKLNVSWFRPDFEEHWEEYAQSPVYFQVSISFGSSKQNFNLPISSKSLNLTISKANLNSTFQISAKFVYQNGVTESIKKQVKYTAPKSFNPKPFVMSRVEIVSDPVYNCIFYARPYDASGREDQTDAKMTTTFQVSNSVLGQYQTTNSLDLEGKSGLFRIEATVRHSGIVKTATTTIVADSDLGFCETYLAPRKTQSPTPRQTQSAEPKAKLRMPLKMYWPILINSTSYGSYKLSIETRVAMSGFTCNIRIGPNQRTLALDSFGLGSLTFYGLDLFYLPSGSPGSISGTCESSKYEGTLPIVIMKKTSLPDSTWWLIESN